MRLNDELTDKITPLFDEKSKENIISRQEAIYLKGLDSLINNCENASRWIEMKEIAIKTIQEELVNLLPNDVDSSTVKALKYNIINRFLLTNDDFISLSNYRNHNFLMYDPKTKKMIRIDKQAYYFFKNLLNGFKKNNVKNFEYVLTLGNDHTVIKINLLEKCKMTEVSKQAQRSMFNDNKELLNYRFRSYNSSEIKNIFESWWFNKQKPEDLNKPHFYAIHEHFSLDEKPKWQKIYKIFNDFLTVDNELPVSSISNTTFELISAKIFNKIKAEVESLQIKIKKLEKQKSEKIKVLETKIRKEKGTKLFMGLPFWNNDGNPSSPIYRLNYPTQEIVQFGLESLDFSSEDMQPVIQTIENSLNEDNDDFVMIEKEDTQDLNCTTSALNKETDLINSDEHNILGVKDEEIDKVAKAETENIISPLEKTYSDEECLSTTPPFILENFTQKELYPWKALNSEIEKQKKEFYRYEKNAFKLEMERSEKVSLVTDSCSSEQNKPFDELDDHLEEFIEAIDSMKKDKRVQNIVNVSNFVRNKEKFVSPTQTTRSFESSSELNVELTDNKINEKWNQFLEHCLKIPTDHPEDSKANKKILSKRMIDC